MIWLLTSLKILLLLWNVASYQVKPANYQEIIDKTQEYLSTYENEFYEEYQRYRQSGSKSKKLQEFFSKLKTFQHLRNTEIDDMDLARQTTQCQICRSTVSTFLNYRREFKYDREELKQEAYLLCTNLDLQEPHVCEQLIEFNIDAFILIGEQRPKVTARTVCGIIFQSGTCQLTDSEFLDWSVRIDKRRAAKIQNSKIASITDDLKPLKIIQLTDFHWDPKYVVGNNANCKEPLCCRQENDIPEDLQDGAGYWGDYRHCDTPWHTLVDAVQHVYEQHPDVDYIYYTGDFVHHGIWDTNIEGNKDLMKKIYQLMRDTFGKTPVFPILGNHETHPVNLYAPSYVRSRNFTTHWLYEYSAQEWSTWLPPRTMRTIKNSGYYTHLIRPGFRLIALNNNDCYTYNWWILYDPKILSQQLQWLHDTLLQAERNKEKVHILMHIPPGEGSCYRIWAREYRRIVDRFWNTITGQFNGHTHRNEIYVYYSKDNPEHAINVGFNGGSIVTYSWVNPNYIVYEVDPKSFEVKDFQSWSFNLTEANLTPESKPKWVQSYSFKEAFDLDDLSPASMDSLVHRLAANKSELKKYWEFKVKSGDPFLEEGCDDECLLNNLCEIVTTETGDDAKCQQLSTIFLK